MTDETLRQLLRRAEASDSISTPAPAVLAQALLRRRHTQRRRTRFLTIFSVASVLLASTFSLYFHPTRLSPPKTSSVASLRATVNQLNDQMNLYLAIAARAQATERANRATRAFQSIQATAFLERERCAALVLSDADWRRAHGQSAAASDDYYRLIHLFADTRAASSARDRIDHG